MKIVVTGAAGFLGSRVVERLRAGGHEVVAVDRVASGLEHRAAEAVIRIDLAHAELREVFEGAASLVHLAGGFPVDAVSLDGAADDIDVAMRVLEHAAGVGVRHALAALGADSSPRGAAALAEAWRPWRSYALHHLWASL